MQRRLFGGIVVLALLPLLFDSCGEDETPVSGISFELTEMTVDESDGSLSSFHPDIATALGFGTTTGKTYTVKILLSRKLAETVVLKYSLSGTATNINGPGTYTVNDYSVSEGINTIVGSDKITIEKGATEATIIVTVYEDWSFEVDENDSPIESFTLNLQSVDSGSGKLGEITAFTMNIEEDDAVVFLQWLAADQGNGDTFGDVDLDMYVWLEDFFVNGSANINGDVPDPPYEALFIPAGYPDGKYEFTYPYYSGTSNEVDFEVVMYGRLNGNKYPYFSVTTGEYLLFSGTYMQVNVNKYDEEGAPDPVRIQSMVKSGVNYSSITEIAVPSTGSRYAPGTYKYERGVEHKLHDLKMLPFPYELLRK